MLSCPAQPQEAASEQGARGHGAGRGARGWVPCSAAEPPRQLLKTLVSGPNLASATAGTSSSVWLPLDGPGRGTAAPRPTDRAVPVPPSPCWEQARRRGARLCPQMESFPAPLRSLRSAGDISGALSPGPGCSAGSRDGEGITHLEELAELPRGACQGLRIHPCFFPSHQKLQNVAAVCWRCWHLRFLAGGAWLLPLLLRTPSLAGADVRLCPTGAHGCGAAMPESCPPSR